MVRSSCNAHCPGSVPCHDRGVVQQSTQLGCVQRDFVLGESADLDSEWTCKCTHAWTGPRCHRRHWLRPGECDETTGENECYSQYQRSDCSEKTTVTFLKPISKVLPSVPMEPSPYITSPEQQEFSLNVYTEAQWRADLELDLPSCRGWS